MKKDKRTHPRRPVDEQIDFELAGKPLKGSLIDISRGGACVEFDLNEASHQFDLGDQFKTDQSETSLRPGGVVRTYQKRVGIKFD